MYVLNLSEFEFETKVRSMFWLSIIILAYIIQGLSCSIAHQATVESGSRGIHRIRFDGLTVRNWDRIARGIDATKGQFPSYASVTASKYSNQDECGAILISKWHLITSGHCVQDTNDLSVSFDGLEHGSGTKLEVKRQCVHPKYKDQQGDGYGVVILKTPVEFTEEVKAAEFCFNCNIDFESEQIRPQVVGYSLPDETGASVLQHTPVKKVPCDAGTPDSMLCFMANEPAHCKANYGSPLYVESNNQTVVVGLYSGSFKCSYYVPSGECVVDRYISLYNKKDEIVDFVKSCN